MAYNWLTDVWYFSDSVHQRIFSCTESGHCLTLLRLYVHEIKSFAIDPNMRYLFLSLILITVLY